MIESVSTVTGRLVALAGGVVSGELVATHRLLDLSFALSIRDGLVQDPVSDISGREINGRILLVPGARDDPEVCASLLRLFDDGRGPAALIARRVGTTLSTLSLLTGVPVVELYRPDPYTIFRDGARVSIDAGTGTIAGGIAP